LIGGATAIQAIALCVVAVVAAGMVAAIERKRIVELDEERA
jgi:hypothetical protein